MLCPYRCKSSKPDRPARQALRHFILSSLLVGVMGCCLTAPALGASAAVSMSAASLAFGTEAIGNPAPAQTITLSNPGTATLTLSSIAITGISIHDFAQSNNCGTSLAAGSSCAISVTFTPTATGARYGGVTITDNAAGSPQTVSLTGTGATVSGALPSTGSLAFSSQAIGNPTAAQAFTLWNTGSAALSISSIAITGVSINDFAQSNNCGSSLAPGGVCTIAVTFTPTATGARYANVTFTDNAPGSYQTVTLTGTGVAVPGAVLSTGSLAFASEPIGNPTAAQFFTLWNPGSAALSISSIAITGVSINDFVQSNNCGSSLAAGGICTVSVIFSPTANGARYAAVTITDNAAGSPQSVIVTGTGGGSSPVSLSTSSLSLGNQAVDTTSPSQTVTLYNSSATTLNISSIGITGANSSDFSQANTCNSSVAAGGNCTIAILFTPAASGSRTATLSVADNGSGSPQAVALSGTGTHDVVLAWTASGSPGSDGYYVYRGATSGGESSTPLNTTPISGTTYVDEEVQAGQTYYYVLTTVNSNNTTQSAPSPETSASVPSP